MKPLLKRIRFPMGGIMIPGRLSRRKAQGAVAYHGDQVVASASSFISLDGEAEMDISTAESHWGKGLAAACAARMLRDCTERGVTVHWDAQNDVSRHLAEKFGFEVETEYQVYWLPELTTAEDKE